MQGRVISGEAMTMLERNKSPEIFQYAFRSNRFGCLQHQTGFALSDYIGYNDITLLNYMKIIHFSVNSSVRNVGEAQHERRDWSDIYTIPQQIVGNTLAYSFHMHGLAMRCDSQTGVYAPVIVFVYLYRSF